jgi:fucose 4-O-acetylase-like acetyltransferase
MSTAREQWLDIAKGFAILLVVLGHVLIGFLTAGMYPQLHDGLNYVVYTLYSFHMPLFFAISGYLYARNEQRATLEKAGEVAMKKLIRLGIPFIIFSLLQGLMHLALNGYTNHPFQAIRLIKMFIDPFDQFWFLYALLAIFLVVPLLEIATRKDALIFCLLLSVKFIPALFNIHVPFPFFEWLMAYALYFYAGALMARHGQKAITHPLLTTAGALLYIPLNVLLYNPQTLICVQGNPSPLGPTAASVLLAFSGMLFALFVVQCLILPLRWGKALFTGLGLFSFEIYLLHTIPSAATRLVLQKLLHTDNLMLHLTLALAVGILIPVFIGKLATRHKALDFMFYPGKYIKWPNPGKKQLKLPVSAT